MNVKHDTAPITVEMNFYRATKGTFVFMAVDEAAPITTVYAKKHTFSKAPPKITLTIVAAPEGT